ncbi:MAG: hypothetical protein IH971_10060 [Candidatus Marinimicrobia bacterium]|nr:hypothetical protein [Candidatus Neomarinimicrobiota bacterium]
MTNVAKRRQDSFTRELKQEILERREKIERRPLQSRRQRKLGSAKCISLFKTEVAYIALTMYHHSFNHIPWQGLEQA